MTFERESEPYRNVQLRKAAASDPVSDSYSPFLVQTIVPAWFHGSRNYQEKSSPVFSNVLPLASKGGYKEIL